jgi:dTDP-4-amino-4,6-dideoxy-D-galactose acyltransferase
MSLEWDSRFFGFPVARIRCAEQSPAKLERELRSLERRGCRLLYWFGGVSGAPRDTQLTELGGTILDRRLTFSRSLTALAARALPATTRVELFEDRLPTPALEELALLAGRCSRFRTDPRIGRAKFEELYLRWIAASVSREAADAVFVIREGGIEQGFVSVRCRDGVGEIGLIGVSEPMRGRGLGSDLVDASLAYFESRRCRRARVVTQEANREARALYERSGYAVEEVERVCHFWLPSNAQRRPSMRSPSQGPG